MDEYEVFCEEASSEFRELVQRFLDGLITLQVFRLLFSEKLREHVGELLLLGSGGVSLVTDMMLIENVMAAQEVYLTGFIIDLPHMTPNRALFRGSMYAWNRTAFIMGNVPFDVAVSMPLPGEICLGGDMCKCSLEVHDVGDFYDVYWRLGVAEHCAACIAASIQYSPIRIAKSGTS
jgi:hypothetical protein